MGRTSKRHFDLKDFLLKKKEEEDLAVTLLTGMAGEGRAKKGSKGRSSPMNNGREDDYKMVEPK